MDEQWYGVDWNGPVPDQDSSILHPEGVEIPDTPIVLSPEDNMLLTQQIDPLRYSECNGVDIYLDVLSFLASKLN